MHAESRVGYCFKEGFATGRGSQKWYLKAAKQKKTSSGRRTHRQLQKKRSIGELLSGQKKTPSGRPGHPPSWPSPGCRSPLPAAESGAYENAGAVVGAGLLLVLVLVIEQ